MRQAGMCNGGHGTEAIRRDTKQRACDCIRAKAKGPAGFSKLNSLARD